MNSRYRLRLELDIARVRGAISPPAAFLMIRRVAWQAVGGFDEGFHPVWFEDVDFCRRLRDRGFAYCTCRDADGQNMRAGDSVSKLALDSTSRGLVW